MLLFFPVVNGLFPSYFVDVLRFMTGISAERDYVRDGKVTKMVVFEITDAR